MPSKKTLSQVGDVETRIVANRTFRYQKIMTIVVVGHYFTRNKPSDSGGNQVHS